MPRLKRVQTRKEPKKLLKTHKGSATGKLFSEEARLRLFQTRQMKEYIHAAANAPIPGYEHLKMEPLTPGTRVRPTQNSAMRP